MSRLAQRFRSRERDHGLLEQHVRATDTQTKEKQQNTIVEKLRAAAVGAITCMVYDV